MAVSTVILTTMLALLGVWGVCALIDFTVQRFFHHKEEFTRRIMRQGGRYDG